MGSLAASGRVLTYSGSTGDTIGQDTDLGIDSDGRYQPRSVCTRGRSAWPRSNPSTTPTAPTRLATRSYANGVEIDASRHGKRRALGNLIGTNAAPAPDRWAQQRQRRSDQRRRQ